MPGKTITKIILVSALMLFGIYGFGQSEKNSNKSNLASNWQINFNLGFTQFYGDASNSGYFNKLSGQSAFGLGFTVRKYFSPVFGFGFNYLYTGLKSHKDMVQGVASDITLDGKYMDGNLHVIVDFNALFWGPSDRKFSVYGILGIGFANWASTLSNSKSGLVVNTGDQIGGVTYENTGFVMPFGMGVNYNMSSTWALNFEINLRTVFNDDVDVWRDGFRYDQPLYTSLGISYFINRKAYGKRDKKPKGRPVTNQPAKPVVPLYDYRLQPDPTSGGGGGKTEPGVIMITPPEKKMSKGVEFRVQILAKRINPPTAAQLKSRFNITGEVYENYQDGIYRFSTGSFSTYREALEHSYLIRNKGVHDAFVVAYRNNNRIKITPEMKQ